MSKPKIRLSFKEKYPDQPRLGKCKALNKWQYPSREAARKDAKRYRKAVGPRLHQFFCKYCESWHNGHDRPPTVRKKKTPRDAWELHQKTPKVDPSLVDRPPDFTPPANPVPEDPAVPGID